MPSMDEKTKKKKTIHLTVDVRDVEVTDKAVRKLIRRDKNEKNEGKSEGYFYFFVRKKFIQKYIFSSKSIQLEELKVKP